MNPSLKSAPVAATRRPLSAIALSALWLAGCGGAGQDLAEAPPAVVQAAASVPLEGCVVDALWLSAPGVAVHARASDGRAIGTTFTDSRGVFRMNVPARSSVVVDTAVSGEGGLVLDTGSAPLTVAGCLSTAV